MKTRVFLVLFLQIISLNGFTQLNDLIVDLELKLLKGQNDSVICISNDIINKDSCNAYAFYYKGKAFQSKYRFFDAEKSFEKAYMLDTTNRVFQNSLAEVLEAIGKDEEAIDLYYSQYLNDTLDISPIISLANIFRKKREFGSAIYYYQKALGIDPYNFYYNKLIAYCFYQINLSAPAIIYYTITIDINPYDMTSYVILANILNGEREFQRAINICKKGLEINNLDVQLKKLLAYTYYLNKEFNLSVAGFDELLENSDSVFFNIKYRGLAHFENKDFEKAICDLKKAYEIDPKDTEVTFYLGSALGRGGDYVESFRYLNAAIRLLAPPPKDMANIYSELAYIESQRENYSSALDNLKLAYQNQPNPVYSFKIGQLFDHHLNNKKLAIDYYDGYLTLLNEKKEEEIQVSSNDSLQIVYKEYAIQRIQVLKEELFFEVNK